MSWSMEFVGNREQLQEAVKRHAHHHWRHMNEAEAGLARHAVGHAVDVATQHEPEKLYNLRASGYDSTGSAGVNVECIKIPNYLPPPVPDDAQAPS